MTLVDAPTARRLRIRGVVQGVGFRPFVFRLAQAGGLGGWVANDGDGVRIHVEGALPALDAFIDAVRDQPPPAARIAAIDVEAACCAGCTSFAIRESAPSASPTTHVSPDLPVCAECLDELSHGEARRRGYPYVNCTNCGPRHSIVRRLPYDRPHTTMDRWTMCVECAREYRDPADRRFHAQPIACWHCGPTVSLTGEGAPARFGAGAIEEAARLLGRGAIVAVKGIGGYHLACDAADAEAVERLRARKFRKEKPFALMARDLASAHRLVTLSADAEALLTSTARPIVLAPARAALPGVAPDTTELGVMLPYTPLHHLLFAAGCPDVLVMTSGNRSSEPIAYDDEDARARLRGIADDFLVGERAIARRVEDSVVRDGVCGTVVLRRSRGLAPGAVARLPSSTPLLALGADLKSAITLVVHGDAFVSHHLGDLDDHASAAAFDETVADMLLMYGLSPQDVVVAHDRHPQYVSTRRAQALPAVRRVAVQHHRAHVASVLAERGALDARAVGIAFDGTGYGDDEAIWGGELFTGSLAEGLTRAGHLREAALPGGDAAARDPVQAAAGFLADVHHRAVLTSGPFDFPPRYTAMQRLIETGTRTFRTTSVGRLFDAVAALLGFTRRVTFEGQAAIWLEHQARQAGAAAPLPLPFDGGEIDFRPALQAIVCRRTRGEDPRALARAFHAGLAQAVADAAAQLCDAAGTDVVVLSGGVFQNELLLAELLARLQPMRLRVWTNRHVPPNDGGISLGQAALAAARPAAA